MPSGRGRGLGYGLSQAIQDSIVQQGITGFAKPHGVCILLSFLKALPDGDSTLFQNHHAATSDKRVHDLCDDSTGREAVLFRAFVSVFQAEGGE